MEEEEKEGEEETWKKKSEKGRCSSDGAEGTGVKERGKVWREKEARKKKEQMK